MRFPYVVLLSACALTLVLPVLAQSPNGVLNGIVVDASNSAIVGADVIAQHDTTGVQYSTKTNGEGIYVLPNLPPGTYRLQVSKFGFKTILKPDIVVHVQDALALNFTLPVGTIAEVVTVTGGAPLLNTENGAVSTVVDREFAENLPMNGRSFQSLIELTPGVVLVPSVPEDGGQFSINGQRANANYWMVDGVSANVGSGTSSGSASGVGGSVGSFSVLGGTNSLVSVDALQEFRIQTSTFAPEFGRTPGGQISIATRSGTNRFHGTAFDYLRNDSLDANDWFNGFNQTPPLRKAQERQNDFGGTLGGPVIKDRTFFFFSYEGLRLRLPQTVLTTVPDIAARQNASPELQPYLNAFPLPNGADNPITGVADLNLSFSNPATLDATSLRIDHRINDKVAVFARYDYSPSQLDQRGGVALSTIFHSRIALQTATGGATFAISPHATNDLRINYTRADATSNYTLDGLHGAVPLTSLPLASGFSAGNGVFQFTIRSLKARSILVGANARNLQRQINLVDSLTVQKGSHVLKFGADFRRLSPLTAPPEYREGVQFSSVADAGSGNSLFGFIFSSRPSTLLFRNVGLYAQDTWQLKPRLTVTYGLRWDLDVVPSSLEGPAIPAVSGYSLTDFSKLTVLQPGASPFGTAFTSMAPRFGLAYEMNQSQKWQSVLRGGFGVFYDLISSEVGNSITFGFPPFQANNFNLSGPFPYTSSQIAPVPIPSAGTIEDLYAFNPNLKSPYTLEWNVSAEQKVGSGQTVSVSYVGSSGRRLLQTANIINPPSNPDLTGLLVDNTSHSDYNALQIQFNRRLSQGLQALASYTWSHSLDDGSAGSAALTSNKGIPGADPRVNRGPSDFDIRNAFSAGLSYELPKPKLNPFLNVILRGWATQNFLTIRSAQPLDVVDGNFSDTNLSGSVRAEVRPDVVPGQPFYLFGNQYPGGKALNPDAFQDPPNSGGIPDRQGNLGRNALRGFGAWQWDFAVHREFPIHEVVKVQFRAEMFNVLNHPNFAPPSPTFGFSGFGISNQMLGQYLGGSNLGGGGLSPLYQLGGPRSIQFALKLFF
jgi:Carboxypeptidase regulatory-like domain/TonB dependent receptor